LCSAAGLWSAGFRDEAITTLRSGLDVLRYNTTLLAKLGEYYFSTDKTQEAAHSLVLAVLFGDRRPDTLELCAAACAKASAYTFAVAVAQINYLCNNSSATARASYALHFAQDHNATAADHLGKQMEAFGTEGPAVCKLLAKFAKTDSLKSLAIELMFLADGSSPTAELLYNLMELYESMGDADGAARAMNALALMSTRPSADEAYRTM
jgi:hypothetical protein